MYYKQKRRINRRKCTMSEKMKSNVTTKQEGNKSNDTANRAIVRGRIETDFKYDHKTWGKRFYRTRVIAKRLSGTEDFVPIMVSDFLMGEEMKKESLEGKWVEVKGQFRSYRTVGEDGHRHLDLVLFVTDMNIYENEGEEKNFIYLDGYLCKPPTFRETPSGKQITDLLIAVNRAYRESDYIPCISWGTLAQQMSKFDVGTRVTFYGRIQSRKYFKKISKDSEIGEYREAYEISINRLQKVNDENLTVEENI